jgi:subtilisin family serine protease
MIKATTLVQNLCFIFVTVGMVACADSSSAHGSSCQNPSASAQSGLNFPTDVQGDVHLLIQMSDIKTHLAAFRDDLAAAHAKAPQLNKFRLVQISQDTLALDLDASSPARDVIESYLQQKKIDFVEPNYRTFSTEMAEAQTAPNSFAETPAATAPTLAGRKQIIVAIIDSGVDYTHKDLAPYMWHNPGEIPNNGIDDDNNGFVDDYYGYDFANNKANPMADDQHAYHGTHVAGIVKSAAQLSRAGFNVKIMALKYLDSTGTGFTGNAIKAIDYAIRNGATVLNNSWGSTGMSQALSNAIERARRAHVLFVAAAGNGDANGNGINIDQRPFYPAAFTHDNIISVAAAGAGDFLARFSNYGRVSVDLAAPGVNITSTRNGNTYAVLSGTSMASPYVAGVASMLWSLRPDLSYREIRRILFQSVNSAPILWGKVATSGRIDPTRAMTIASQFTHDPNDVSVPEFTDSTGTCSP